MKRKPYTSNQSNGAKYNWKRRPSEIRGYHRTLYMTSEDGDYLRVDYNIKEKRIRLYIEVDDEGGNPYYAVISNGKVTAERSVTSGRSYGFSNKFAERSGLFSSIPNKEVLRLINRNYNISLPGENKIIKRQKIREETREKYFKGEYAPANKRTQKNASKKPVEIKVKLIDFIDVGIGTLLSVGTYLYFNRSYIAMGILAAFYGIIIGFVDIFFRDRSPLFFKVLLFIFFGTVIYIYGYFFF